MPPRPRRSSVMARRPARRRTTWVQYDQGITPGALGNSTTQDLLVNYKNAGGIVLGVTVLVTHLKWFVTSAVAAGDGFSLGCLVDDTSNVFASQVNAYNPTDSPYLDWMLNDRFGAHPAYGMTTSNSQGFITLKSKRRIDDLERSYLVSAKNTGAVANLTITIFARILLALP